MVVLTIRRIHAQATFQTKMPELQLLGPDVLFTPPSQPGSCICFPPKRDLFPGKCLAWFLDVFSSELGTPASLKHHVYTSDITIMRYDLGSKYDIKMGPKCSSTMDPQGSFENRKNTYA